MLTPCGAIVQRHDPERFVTVLFAPAARREVLFTLYAFNHELARAREIASHPTLALIRLTWWREVLEGARRAHEVAGPLGEALDAKALDQTALAEMVDARMMEAEDSIDEPGWANYLAGAAGALMRAAGLALGASSHSVALTRLGSGCGAVGLLRNRQAHAAAGRWTAPGGRDERWIADQAASLLGPRRRWPAEALPAALPAVFARRNLPPRAAPPQDGWSRAAVWWAAHRGVV